MQAGPGTYVIILRSDVSTELQVGRWGMLNIRPAYYSYVGSAFGSGGVRARVMRHFRAGKPKHWHIDYLRELTVPVGAWYSHAPERLEHEWAQHFQDMSGVAAEKGFGCSDCRCYSHLFVTASLPDLTRFTELAGDDIHPWRS